MDTWKKIAIVLGIIFSFTYWALADNITYGQRVTRGEEIIGLIPGTSLTGDSTSYVRVSTALQSGAMFHVTSGTIAEGLSVLGAIRARGSTGLVVNNTRNISSRNAADNADNALIRLNASNVIEVGETTLNPIAFFDSGLGEAMRITGSSVAIGATVPSSRLDVAIGSVTIRGLNSGLRVQYDITASSGIFDGIRSTGSVNLATVDVAGNNVGVGTANPRAKLEVRSPGGAQILLSGAGGANRNFAFDSSFGEGGDFGIKIATVSDGNPLAAGGFYTRLYISSAGFVGINTSTPLAMLHVDEFAGNDTGVWSNLAGSDKRIKKNIKPITGALDKISILNGVTYEWKNPHNHKGESRARVGFTAQNFAEAFPDDVFNLRRVGDSDDLKLIPAKESIKTYGIGPEFHATMVEAIKELKAKVLALEAEVKILKLKP